MRACVIFVDRYHNKTAFIYRFVMQKINFIQQYPHLFSATDTPEIITVPARCYLSVKGTWILDKNDQYQQAKRLLKGLAFLIKHTYKQNPPLGFFDYTLPPYEIIRTNPDATWDKKKWILLLLQPNYVDKTDVDKACEFMKKKHEEDDVKIPTLSLVSYPEKKAVQIHHTWSYTAQKRDFNAMTKLATTDWYALISKKHEIFLKNHFKSPPGESNILIRYMLKRS